ncbi:MAG: hypothetical protein K2V38_25150 [Gemmataceae bacterium]|nr:hypothetical protein [Gemmataceae bacterium]
MNTPELDTRPAESYPTFWEPIAVGFPRPTSRRGAESEDARSARQAHEQDDAYAAFVNVAEADGRSVLHVEPA